MNKTTLRVCAALCFFLGSGVWGWASSVRLLTGTEPLYNMTVTGSVAMRLVAGAVALLLGVLLLSGQQPMLRRAVGHAMLWCGAMTFVGRVFAAWNTFARIGMSMQDFLYVVETFLKVLPGLALVFAAYTAFLGRGRRAGIIASLAGIALQLVLFFVGMVQFLPMFGSILPAIRIIAFRMLTEVSLVVLPLGALLWLLSDAMAAKEGAPPPEFPNKFSLSFCGVAVLCPLMGGALWALFRGPAPRCAKPTLITAVGTVAAVVLLVGFIYISVFMAFH